MRSGCGSFSGVGFDSSAAEDGVVAASGLGFEGIETVAKPRAGLEAGFFFFLLLGGIMAGLSVVPAEMSSKHAESQRSKTSEFGL